MKNIIFIIVALIGLVACSKDEIEPRCAQSSISSIDQRIEVVLNGNHTIYLPPHHTYNFSECTTLNIVVRSAEHRFKVNLNGRVIELEGSEDIDITQFK